MHVHEMKTGMIANIDMMKIIKKHISSKNIPFVIDPVMVATSGDSLIDEDARDYLRQYLLPLCTVVTPNLPEAEYITGMEVNNLEKMKEAAEMIVHDFGASAALVKGGHLVGDAIDFLYDGKEIHTFPENRIDTVNTHGTGCTYSAAITAYLSHGLSLFDAVKQGKKFVTEAIKQSFDLGSGNGPTNHWAIRGK